MIADPNTDPQLYFRSNEDKYATWKRHQAVLTRHWWIMFGTALALLIGCGLFAWLKLWVSTIPLLAGFAVSCASLVRQHRMLTALKKALDDWRTSLPQCEP